MTAINRLNEVQREREKLISDIISKRHNPKTDRQFDLLERRYKRHNYQKLVNIHNKLLQL